MSKVKISELPDFDAADSIKTIDDVKDWLETSIQEDKTFEDFKITLQIIIRGIDKHISNLN